MITVGLIFFKKLKMQKERKNAEDARPTTDAGQRSMTKGHLSESGDLINKLNNKACSPCFRE